jgi:glyoxylase-like metal-dependent hydrolase (beta-lactamase superfamily II)
MLRQQLGDIVIDRIVESEEPNFDPLVFFPQSRAEDWLAHKGWMQPHALHPASGWLILTLQSYLVRTRHHTILVDTCVGDHKKRLGKVTPPSWHMASGGVLLDKLAAAGVAPEAIDYVMCTHLHSDHVGWNTRLVDGRWVPTFPNARYVMSRKELAHWQSVHDSHPLESLADSVLPIVEAGRADLVSSDFALDGEVWLEPTPGHTPDHFSVRLASNGGDAVITGDLLHSPVQCREPSWGSLADFDAALASRTRRAFLERCCDTGMLVCGTHFPSPSFGRVVPHADAFHFAYEAA